MGAVALAANINDTTMFPKLLRLALVVGVAISRLLEMSRPMLQMGGRC